MISHPRRALGRALFLAGTLVALVVIPLAGSAPALGKPGKGGPAQIVVLSNRPDLISGGDALVQIVLPDKADPASAQVTLNGNDITTAFAVRPNGLFEGLVTGLAAGENEDTPHDHEPSDRRTGLRGTAGPAVDL